MESSKLGPNPSKNTQNWKKKNTRNRLGGERGAGDQDPAINN